MAVHRIVIAAFIGPAPDGLVVNHKNGVKTDNRVSNLEYVTPEENAWHAWRIGLFDGVRGENHYRAVVTSDMLVDAQRRLSAGERMRAIADEHGVKLSTLRQAVNSPPRWYEQGRNAQREESAK